MTHESAVQTLQLSPVKEFTYRACMAANRPCIITGLFDVLPALSQWNLETARQRIPEKDLSVMVTPISADRISGDARREKMTTTEYFDHMCDNTGENRYYLAMQSIEKVLPELRPYVGFDTLLPAGRLRSTNFWLGPGSTKVCLHLDPYDNFFMQLMGTKTFYLFAPTDRKYLYPNSAFRRSPEESKVDPTNIDFEKFPLARHAKLIKVTLNAGDLLFLPIYWWHAVVGGSEVTMSINLWCKGKTYSSWTGVSQLMPRQVMEIWRHGRMKLFAKTPAS
jgi:hypothetical protein